MAGKKKSADIISLATTGVGACPLCGRATHLDFRPFCSKRCADKDLGHWLMEDYRIASDEDLDDDEDLEG